MGVFLKTHVVKIGTRLIRGKIVRSESKISIQLKTITRYIFSTRIQIQSIFVLFNNVRFEVKN